MNKVYQMSDLEYNAFIEHCKSSETYKEKAIVTKASKMIEPTGEMAREEDDSYLSELNKEDYYDLFEKGIWLKDGKMYSIIETKTIKIKGYNGEY
tara:strand:+ start:83 stop:367 length:285 start_codon:yes stop_codon:yes gene_type:complete